MQLWCLVGPGCDITEFSLVQAAFQEEERGMGQCPNWPSSRTMAVLAPTLEGKEGSGGRDALQAPCAVCAIRRVPGQWPERGVLSVRGRGPAAAPREGAQRGFTLAPSWSRPQHRTGPGHPPPRRDCAGAELPPQRHGHRHDDQDRRPQVALPPLHQDPPEGEPPDPRPSRPGGFFRVVFQGLSLLWRVFGHCGPGGTLTRQRSRRCPRVGGNGEVVPTWEAHPGPKGSSRGPCFSALQMFRHTDSLFPILLQTLSDESDEVGPRRTFLCAPAASLPAWLTDGVVQLGGACFIVVVLLNHHPHGRPGPHPW